MEFLGYSFFLNNIVEINYEKNKINVYKDREILEKPRIKKYVSLPLKVRGNRPYVEVKTHIGKDSLDLDLLVDVGLSDGLWLIESEKIKCQDEFFEASLGIGFSGEIKGKKSRVNAIEFAGFKLEKPLVSYPYPDYLKKIVISDKRNGSVGNEVLHRFNIFFDNRGKQILLKKNSMFSKDFNYNMSGLTVEHAGIEYVPELVRLSTSTTNSSFNSSGDFKYNFVLKKLFEVATVSQNSPAALAGILPNDKIIRINKRNAHDYTLQNINDLLQSEDGKWIYMDIIRNGKAIAFKFQLKKIL